MLAKCETQQVWPKLFELIHSDNSVWVNFSLSISVAQKGLSRKFQWMAVVTSLGRHLVHDATPLSWIRSLSFVNHVQTWFKSLSDSHKYTSTNHLAIVSTRLYYIQPRRSLGHSMSTQPMMYTYPYLMVVFSTITLTPFCGHALTWSHVSSIFSQLGKSTALDNPKSPSHHILTWLIASKEDLIKECLRRFKEFHVHKEKGDKSTTENQALHLESSQWQVKHSQERPLPWYLLWTRKTEDCQKPLPRSAKNFLLI